MDGFWETRPTSKTWISPADAQVSRWIDCFEAASGARLGQWGEGQPRLTIVRTRMPRWTAARRWSLASPC